MGAKAAPLPFFSPMGMDKRLPLLVLYLLLGCFPLANSRNNDTDHHEHRVNLNDPKLLASDVPIAQRCGTRHHTDDLEQQQVAVREAAAHKHRSLQKGGGGPGNGNKPTPAPGGGGGGGGKPTNTEPLNALRIPVCFHVIFDSSSPDPRITKENLQTLLEHANEAFSSKSCCPKQEWWCTGKSPECSVETDIRFGMYVENGSSDTTVNSVLSEGACVTFTDNAGWYSQETQHASMKQALRKGDKRVLNVYFVSLEGNLGYATFPWMIQRQGLALDGVVVQYKTVPGVFSSKYTGDIFVHEVGHWLGLLHTFHNGCDGASDGVEDTPPERSAYTKCDAETPTARNTCSNDDRHDPVFNFMDYSDEECKFEFTAGQVEVIRASWKYYRSPITSEEPVVLAVAMNTVSPPTQLVPGSSVVYRVDMVGRGGRVTCRLVGKEGTAVLYVRREKMPFFDMRDDCTTSRGGNLCSLDVTLINPTSSQNRLFQRQAKTHPHAAAHLYVGVKVPSNVGPNGVYTPTRAIIKCYLA